MAEIDGPADEDDSLARKLDHLFHTVHPPRRGEYSYEEVAAGIRERGIAISHTYIWQLRRGARTNPTKRHIAGLAAFFGVPPSYFFDDEVADRIDDELDVVVALRDTQIRGVALRMVDLTPASVETIKGLVDRIRKIEGLPDPEDTDPAGPSS
jgi:transcriptional regulator with XRE-family HTH domain